MVGFKQMRQLVCYHVISDTCRKLQQLPIEVDYIVLTTRAPTVTQIADIDSCRYNS